MKNAQDTQTYVNDTETSSPTRTPLAHDRSRPVRYEIVDKDGRTWGPYETHQGAAEIAKKMFPNQERDDDRTGNGWTVQPVGADIVWQRSPLGPVKV